MGLQPRRAAGPCPPAGRCAALPAARTAAAWARSEEPEGAPGRTASLPPILPAPAAASPVAARAQPKKPAAAPKKAAPRPAEEEEKAARKARGAPPERAGPLSSSWPCSSLQRQPPRRPPAERGARPQPAPPQPRGTGQAAAARMEVAAAAAPGGGPGTLLLCLALASGLAFFSCVGADVNVTASHSMGRLTCGMAESCTGNVTQLRRQGHFSRCPEEYKHYCVKGRCRFLVAEKAPACVCERGYTGARCERVDIFYLRGDQGQIVIISLIATIVTLIVLVICTCLCSHHCRKQRRKRKAEEMETLNKNLPSKSEDVLETGIV